MRCLKIVISGCWTVMPEFRIIMRRSSLLIFWVSQLTSDHLTQARATLRPVRPSGRSPKQRCNLCIHLFSLRLPHESAHKVVGLVVYRFCLFSRFYLFNFYRSQIVVIIRLSKFSTTVHIHINCKQTGTQTACALPLYVLAVLRVIQLGSSRDANQRRRSGNCG